MIVCHQGDYVELTLINPATNELTHNIDLHAATGGLGGGKLTLVDPGQKVTMRFRAIYAGVFVYHCAPGGLMIPYHVTHGMNGAIMVLPRDGLKDGDGTPLPYDRAYFIGEQDFYVLRKKNGEFMQYNQILEDYQDSLEVMGGLIPSHVVLNGAVDALTGDNALKAKVGERVLIIHAQANRDTRPHLIGGHGDYVWETGAFSDAPAHGLETWFIRGGSAGAALYTFEQPGVYVYLNHDLITAFELGALAKFQVEGKWNDKLMKLVSPAG
jgi:nitrite reductase (NO-forming)